MITICLAVLFLTIFLPRLSLSEDGIASKQFSDKITKRCPYRLKKLWQADVSSFPLAATPLVVDVDGDGGLDVVAAPFGESLAVIEGETGKSLHDTSWPQPNLDKSVHSSPLQYDIDEDGVLDLLFVTSQGEGLFYTGLGHFLHKYTFQLEPAFVKSDWYRTANHVDHTNIHKYVSDKPVKGHVSVDPHVLGTPVVHEMKSLVVPVSFFFDEDEDYGGSGTALPDENADAKDKFYASAVVIVDLEQLKRSRNTGHTAPDLPVVKMYFLELSQTPVFNLFSPTVLDLDGNLKEVEIISGLTSGNLYIMSLDGTHRPGFPQNVGSISGRVVAADLDPEPGLDLIAINMSGVVMCLDSKTGRRKWSSYIGGSIFAGSQIVDVDLDGQLDVVVATDEGKVYALHGDSGLVVTNYPFKAGHRIQGHVLVTKFNAIRGPVDLVFLSDDGTLHILAGDHSCLSQVVLGDFSLVDILVQNVVLMNQGMELIIATADGSLICLGSGLNSPPEELYETEYLLMASHTASPSSPHAHNDYVFVSDEVVVLIDERTKQKKEVTGSSFDLYFTIHGASRGQKQLDLLVYLGSELVHRQKITDLSSSWLQVQAPEQPGQAQVTVLVCDQHGFVRSDSVYLKFNQLILLDLQWLVLAPFIAMVIILLVNHGFPTKDLLPVTFPFKSK